MPTPMRLSPLYTPTEIPHDNMNSQFVSQVYGPMTRNVDDLVQLCRVVFSEAQFNEDLLLPRYNFNEKVYSQTLESKKLKIGLIRDTELICGTCPSNNRAMDMVEELLTSLGHSVVDFEIEDLDQHSYNVTNLLIKSNLTPWVRRTLSYVPNFVLNFFKVILNAFGQKRIANSLITGWGSTEEIFENVKLRFSHMTKLISSWKKAGLD